MTFDQLNLNPLILKAIEDSNYKQMTPIQEKAIPVILSGMDFLGCAETGTGKTAAFAIPILNRLSEVTIDDSKLNQVGALILAPTRELAIQIGENFNKYGLYLNHHAGVVYGGVTPKRHIKVLKREPSIIVGTPGRVLDMIEQGHLDLTHIQYFVLDEVDRMLDLGMIKEVKSIIQQLPKRRQNMMFSATIPVEVNKLINNILINPVKVEVKSKHKKAVDIKEVVYYVEEPDKTALLLELLKEPSMNHVLVFVRTKKKADKVCKTINVSNIRAKAIHSDKSQTERMKVLEMFKNREIRVLVATDVAARGIDVQELSHVVNMDIPSVPENYTHRIGRTGRAGMSGMAISFCSSQEIESLKAIEKQKGHSIKEIKSHPYVILSRAIEENRKAYAEPKTINKKKKRRY